jgi:FolB domain-containing protein
LAAAARSDRLADTLDYAEIHRRVVEVVEQRSFDLIERLGAEILRVLFEDARVQRAEVTIGKPGRLNGATASITLRRAREECEERLGR